MKSISGTVLGAAAAVFLISAAAFGATFVDAIRVDQIPATAGTSDGPTVDPTMDPTVAAAEGGGIEVDAGQEGWEAPARGITYPRVTPEYEIEILDAVNQDLFQPDRTPPIQRYQLPGQRPAPVQASRDNRRTRDPNLRIVGTAIAGDLALAMVQPEDSIPFSVLRGEMVEGWLLAAVTDEWVTLTRDGSEFTLPVMEPQRGRSSNNRDRNSRNRSAEEDAARIVAERLQQMRQEAGRIQMMRGGEVLQARPVELQYVPGVELIRRGGTGGGGTATVVRPRGGGGGGGDLK